MSAIEEATPPRNLRRVTPLDGAYTIGEHWRRFLESDAVRGLLFVASRELWRTMTPGERRHGFSRYGDPFCNYGPTQLPVHASNQREGRRLARRLVDPRYGPLPAVLPKALRPVVWWLALNPKFELPEPLGGRLEWARGEALWTLCEKRLDTEQALTEAERQRLRRDLAALDGQPFSLPATLAAGLGAPIDGQPVAISASALSLGHVVGGASWASYPVVGIAANVDVERREFRVMLDPKKF